MWDWVKPENLENPDKCFTSSLPTIIPTLSINCLQSLPSGKKDFTSNDDTSGTGIVSANAEKLHLSLTAMVLNQCTERVCD